MSDTIRTYIRKAFESGFTPDAVLVKLVNIGHDKNELVPIIREEGERQIAILEKQKIQIKKHPAHAMLELLISIAFFSAVGTMMLTILTPMLI